jgi:putative thioredoxin
MTDAAWKFAATLDNFAAEVVEGSTQTPVLVDFWAPWCGPCRTLMPLLERVVEGYGGRVRLAKVNTDEEQGIAGHFGIRSIPTVMLFKDRQVVEQFVGAQPEAAIRALLDRHLLAAPEAAAASADEAPTDPTERAVWQAQRDLDHHDTAAAKAAIADLASRDPNHRSLRMVQARIAFTEAVAAHPDRALLQSTLERNPADSGARHALAAHHAVAGDYATALQQWLELLRRDRAYGDDLARRSLLQVFDVLGESDELAQSYRRRIAALLY